MTIVTRIFEWRLNALWVHIDVNQEGREAVP